MSPDQVRATALGLAGTAEQPHHGFPSFRVHQKIFATLPDESHLHVMLDEAGILGAVAQWPECCEEKWWGRRLAAVRVRLDAADPAVVAELLEDAWRSRAGQA